MIQSPQGLGSGPVNAGHRQQLAAIGQAQGMITITFRRIRHQIAGDHAIDCPGEAVLAHRRHIEAGAMPGIQGPRHPALA